MHDVINSSIMLELEICSTPNEASEPDECVICTGTVALASTGTVYSRGLSQGELFETVLPGAFFTI